MRTRNHALASVLRLQAQRARLEQQLKAAAVAQQLAIVEKLEQQLEQIRDRLR